jgi:mRNA-degrading endonuclease RelE of RelBE toxin-antitoxin system
VPRPTKKSEHQLVFGSKSAEKGWRDLQSTMRSPLADAWDFLTRTPTHSTPSNYPLKGELATVVRAGVSHQRWQHKPTRQGDARIWFYVHEGVVVLEQVHTAHPNQTKR